MPKRFLLLAGLVFAMSGVSQAGLDASNTCLQVSVLRGFQLFSEETDVYGLRLCLPAGKNENLTGLDVGLWNHIEDGSLLAIQSGVVNVVEDSDVTAVQLGVVNWGDDICMNGLQVAALANVTRGDKGTCSAFQIAGLINYVEDSDDVCLQLAGFMNFNRSGDFTGVQISPFGNNYCVPFILWNDGFGGPMDFSDVGDVTGLQITGPGLFVGACSDQYFFLAGILPANVSGDLAGVQCCGGGLNMAVGDAYGGQIGGLLNSVDEKMTGIQLGIVANVVGGDAKGLQLAGLINGAEGNYSCLQMAALANCMGTDEGSKSYGSGAQIGAINYAMTLKGLQVGVINVSKGNSSGLQVGVINYAEVLKGVQIGAINVNTKSSLPFFPVINGAF